MCGGAVPSGRLDGPGRVCGACPATPRSIELAATVVATFGRGIARDLRDAGPPETARILDLTGDRAVAAVLSAAPRYRAATVLTGLPSGHPLAALPVLDPLAPGAAYADLLLARDVLFTAEDVDAALDALASRIAPGGWLVLQERFEWPLPPATRPAEPGRTRPVAADVRRPEHHILGADLVERLGRLGLVAEFLRPGLCCDVAYRSAVLAAIRP